MKKILKFIGIGVVTIIVLVMLFGGSETEKVTPTKVEEIEVETEEIEVETEEVGVETEEVKETSGSATLGETFIVADYEIKVNSIREGKNYEGKDSVIVNYDWTNNSDETTSAWLTISMTAFQDGQQIESTIISGSNDNGMKELRPKNTIKDIEQAFIVDSKSEIEIEFSEFISFNDDKVLIILDYPTE